MTIKYNKIWEYAKMLADKRHNQEYIISEIERHFDIKLSDDYLEALENDLNDYDEE